MDVEWTNKLHQQNCIRTYDCIVEVEEVQGVVRRCGHKERMENQRICNLR